MKTKTLVSILGVGLVVFGFVSYLYLFEAQPVVVCDVQNQHCTQFQKNEIDQGTDQCWHSKQTGEEYCSPAYRVYQKKEVDGELSAGCARMFEGTLRVFKEFKYVCIGRHQSYFYNLAKPQWILLTK